MPWGDFLGPDPASGVWWRFEFDNDVSARQNATVRDWNDLSINVLELLGMVVTEFMFVTQSDARPSYARDYHVDAGGTRPPINRRQSAKAGDNTDQGRSCA